MKKLMSVILGALALFGATFAQSCPASIEQTFQSGPNFFTWRLSQTFYEFDGTNTTICYELMDVTPGGSGDRQISHFSIRLDCEELFDSLIDVTYNGTSIPFSTGPDPTTGVNGVKVESADPGTYCFIYEGEFELGCTIAALKNGNTTAPLQQAIVGLECEGGDGAESNISGVKWYDANANGILDGSESGIAGWEIEVCIDVDGPSGPEPEFCFITCTDANGFWSVDGDAGWFYSVSERNPIESNWYQTYPFPNLYAGQYTAGATFGLDFGNLCLGEGGGRTKGFWGNKNGQKLIDAADLAALVALNLKNEDGSDFNPTSKGGVKAFLKKSRAVNMQYMLSAQLIAMVLNVREGFVDGSALVLAGDCGNTGAGNQFITIDDLINAADDALGDPFATRDELECLKDALDDANNNLTFVQATPCPFTFAP